MNICGTSNASCLPSGWVDTYQYGVAVQFWGTTPSCATPQCVDKASNTPVCCTANCQVLGVGAPAFQLVDALNQSSGVVMTFQQVPPVDADPFWCPYDPATNKQYNRSITYTMRCDQDAKGATAVKLATDDINTCACVVPRMPSCCTLDHSPSLYACVCVQVHSGIHDVCRMSREAAVAHRAPAHRRGHRCGCWRFPWRVCGGDVGCGAGLLVLAAQVSQQLQRDAGLGAEHRTIAVPVAACARHRTAAIRHPASVPDSAAVLPAASPVRSQCMATASSV